MKNENLIHVKFEYNQALQSKKDVLSSEMSLLKIAKSIKNYHSLRSEELNTKLKFRRKIKEINTEIRKLQTTLPKLKIPEILNKNNQIEEVDKTKKKIKKPKETKNYNDLEYQLQEIQNKLKVLAR